MTRTLLFFLAILIYNSQCFIQASTDVINDTHMRQLTTELNDHLISVHPFNRLPEGIESIFRDDFCEYLKKEQGIERKEEEEEARRDQCYLSQLIRVLQHRSDFRINAAEVVKSALSYHLKIYIAVPKTKLLECLKHYEKYITTLIKKNGLNIKSIEFSSSRPEPLIDIQSSITSTDHHRTGYLDVRARHTTQSALSKEVSTFIRNYYRKHQPHLARRLNLLIHYKEEQADIHAIISFKRPISINKIPAKIGFRTGK